MLKIKLNKVENKNKEGKVVKDEKGNVDYEQHDSFALNQVINAWDSKKGNGMEDLKMQSKISDKLKRAWYDDLKEIELSSNEVVFLKDYLEKFKEKMVPQATLTSFHNKTMVSIYEQLEEEGKEEERKEKKKK